MDLSVGGTYPGGIPKAPKQWEQYILNQQQDLHKPVSRRRKTTPGIPTLAEFVRLHDEREQAKEHMGRARKDSALSPDDRDSLGGISLDGSLGDESLPRSYASSNGSSGKQRSPKVPLSKRHHHHAPGQRHHRHSSGSRPRLPATFMSAPELPRPGSPATFEERVHRDKARFYSNQHANTLPHLKSHLNSFRLAQEPVPYQPVPKPPIQQPLEQLSLTPYEQWREDCDRELSNKSIMTQVPMLPVPTCSACVNASILGGHPVPITCKHSLDQLLRTGVTERPNTLAFSKAYLATLKAERQRWHTDRFGACPETHKPQIMAAAQQIFVLVNTLYEGEKTRVEEMPPDAPSPTVPVNQHDPTEKWWRNEDNTRPAW